MQPNDSRTLHDLMLLLPRGLWECMRSARGVSGAFPHPAR